MADDSVQPYLGWSTKAKQRKNKCDRQGSPLK